jgi:hypothetical protein
MRNLPRAFKAFRPAQKAVVVALLVLVLLTWLAVCLVFTGTLGPQ